MVYESVDPRIDEIAKAIRASYGASSNRALGPYDELPPHRRHKWRCMAKAAIRTIGSMDSTIWTTVNLDGD